MTDLLHTHYSLYGPPRQVPGTLLSCSDEYRQSAHKVEGSERWADYMYSPRFGPVSATGLSRLALLALHDAYAGHRTEDLEYRIVDVVGDPNYMYRVKLTNRTAYNGDGPDWHTEEWGLSSGGQWCSTFNPHPGYEHWPAFCPDCGY